MGNESFDRIVADILAENERRRREIPADFYSVIHPPNLFISTQRKRSLLRLLHREGIASLSRLRILDVGCGPGDWLLDFVSWGATPDLLCGIDIDEQQIAAASRKLPTADLRLGNACELPWPDGCFDLVLQATVFTSILNTEFKKAIAAEIIRVTRPVGLILWFDFRFNNPWNRHVRGIGGNELRRLFPGCSVSLNRVTLLPPLARHVVPVSWVLGLLLEKIPPLRTHILACIRSPRRLRAERAAKAGSLSCRPISQKENAREEVHYSPMGESEAREVASLHRICFQDFFLTGLGDTVLSVYYSHYNTRADSICFVARTAAGEIVGFVAGSRHYDSFIRSFCRANFWTLAIGMIKAFFVSSDMRNKIRERFPQIRYTVESLFKTGDSRDVPDWTEKHSTEETAGLASVAVSPRFRGSGAAAELFGLFEHRAKQLGARVVELSVLQSNARAIAFYRKVGWEATGCDGRNLVFRKVL